MLPLEQGAELWPAAVAATALIRLALVRNDPDGARHTGDRLRAAVESKQMWAPLARALPALVRAEVAAGRFVAADRLVAVTGDQLAGLDLPLASPAIRSARGVLATAADRWAEAADHFAAAAAEYDERSGAYEAAQAREQAAACWLRLPAAGRAGGEQLRAALASYQRLGATWDLGRARGLARRHGLPVPGRHRGGRRGYGDQPSPREREVAELAAMGRTNAEIAGELFLATGTVKNHLAAAMRKLGVHSRSALAHQLARLAASKNVPSGI